MVCDPRIHSAVFLSSTVRSLGDIRTRLHEIGLARGQHIWVDECCHPTSAPDHLFEVDRFLNGLANSDVYVALLASGLWGSPISIAGEQSATSFFEIELFRAALLDKPIVLLQTRDHSLEPRLQELLDLILPIMPPEAVVDISGNIEAEITEYIQRLLDGTTTPYSTRSAQPLLRRLSQRFFDRRGRTNARAMGSHPLLFMNDRMSVAREPKLRIIEEALRTEADQPDEQRRLGRLWIAYRELRQAPYDLPGNEQFAPHWNTLLSRWGDAASWLGLHGHFGLSALGAINSVTRVRATPGYVAMLAKDAPELRYPGGRLGTAWYSIGRRLLNPVDRWRAFGVAAAEVKRSLDSAHDNRSNLLAIRASVFRQQGRLVAALGDYKAVVQLRQSSGADPGSVGEALAELGFCYLFFGRFWHGIALMEEGVRLLEPSPKRRGFYERALRKLIVGYRLVRNRMKVRETQERLHRSIARSGSLDQDPNKR